MRKATPTTGKFRTHGALAGAIKVSLRSKSRVAMVFAALICGVLTGLTGTLRGSTDLTLINFHFILIHIKF